MDCTIGLNEFPAYAAGSGILTAAELKKMSKEAYKYDLSLKARNHHSKSVISDKSINIWRTW